MSQPTKVGKPSGTPKGDGDPLRSVLESSLFKAAPVLSSLLTYLWENRNSGFSEYAIAVDALGRKADFDSRTDATVRVQISRLRKLLQKYYETEGLQSSGRITIPLGSHQIQLLAVPSGTPLLKQQALEIPGVDSVAGGALRAAALNGRHRVLITTMGATIAILLASIGFLLSSSALRSSHTQSRLPSFWKAFSDNGKSFRLVVPVPSFFTWKLPSEETFLVRDTGMNVFTDESGSDAIKDLEKRMGKPALWQGYANLSDSLAALQLMRFLDSYGINASISSSADIPQGIVDHENIVAFGNTTSMGPYQKDIDQLSYSLGPNSAYVIDKRLPPGSPNQFNAQSESSSRSVRPGIIAFLPRETSRILILEGAQTSALISWLTSEDGMREIDEARAAQGRGPYFEAVVLSEVNGGKPIQSRMVAFRPFSKDSH